MVKMEKSLRSLLDAIQSEQSHDILIKLQLEFTRVIEEAMASFKKGDITVEVSQALPHVMYSWAVEELPEQIRDLERIPSIKKQLILFQNTIDHILHPKEK